MSLLFDPKEKRKALGISLLLTLFSIFPLIYMINESFIFFKNFIGFILPLLIFINIISFFVNKANFTFFILAVNFFYFAFSCLAGFFLATKLYFGFLYFYIFIFLYFILFFYDNYIIYKKGYFYRYEEIFNKNIINGHYLFNNIKEFDELKEVRKDTIIPKLQILYLIFLPFLFIFKGMIFKVSSQDSNLSSGLGTGLILSFGFVYVFGAIMIFVEDFLIRFYLSIRYKK